MVNKLNIPPKKDELIDKVNEIIDNLEDITVDSELSTTSTNPVQNKVITGALNGKQDVLTAGTDLEIVQNSILPSGYTQLNSIITTGAQYINTGLWLTDNFKAEIVGRFTSTTGTQCMLGATVRTSNTTYRNIVLGKNASQYYVGNGSPWYQPNQTNSSATLDTNKHTFVIEITSETTKISVDGVENTATYESSSVEEDLYLFANNAIVSGGTSSVADFAQFEAESVKLYDNGNLTFNGVPYKRGDIAGLYDTVSETFMPSLGSSAFVAGEETPLQKIINFTNESGYINETDLQTALEGKQDTLVAGTDLEIVEGTTVELPEGYTALESISSTGTQYIDTEIQLNVGDIGFYVDFLTESTISNNGNYGAILGGRIASGSDDLQLSTYAGTNTGNVRYGTSTAYAPYIIRGFRTQVSLINGVLNSSNGPASQTVPSYNFTSTRPVYLFGLNNGGIFSQSGLGCTIYRAKLYSGSTIVADFVPARNNETFVLGMYDIVRDRFFTKSGSGTFVAGRPLITGTTINFTNETGYITSASVDTLTDVTLSNLTNGQGLIYNSTTQKWVNTTIQTSTAWGSITGTLSNQTDLQNALNAKSKVTLKDWTV